MCDLVLLLHKVQLRDHHGMFLGERSTTVLGGEGGQRKKGGSTGEGEGEGGQGKEEEGEGTGGGEGRRMVSVARRGQS